MVKRVCLGDSLKKKLEDRVAELFVTLFFMGKA